MVTTRSGQWAFLRTPKTHATGVTAQPQRVVYRHASPVGGQVALDYFSHSSDRPHARDVLFFMLGNPGILEYYHPFLSHLSSLLPETAIISTSHIGHTPTLDAPEEALTLHEQLEAKVELITSLREALDDRDVGESLEAVSNGEGKVRRRKRKDASGADEGRIRLYLMGHSIGAWMAVETAKRLEVVQAVDGVFMLFPTVGWIADSPNGQRLKPIFRFPLIHFLPMFAVLLTPLILLLSALPALAGLLHLPPPTLVLLRSPRTIRHVLRLAASEMRSVCEPDIDYFRSKSGKLAPMHAASDSAGEGQAKCRGVYGIWSDAGVDKWVGKEGAMVQAAMGGIDGGRVRLVGQIPHAFCLSLDHSRYVAEIIAGWIGDVSVPSHDKAELEAHDEAVKSFPM